MLAPAYSTVLVRGNDVSGRWRTHPKSFGNCRCPLFERSGSLSWLILFDEMCCWAWRSHPFGALSGSEAGPRWKLIAKEEGKDLKRVSWSLKVISQQRDSQWDI